MSKVQTLRALVIERLAAAAEEISALFERATAEYEEEEENQRRQRLLDQALSRRVLTNPGPNQDFTETAWIKEEPEEQSVSQEEEQLPVPVCVKSEELMETEADGENHNQVQSRDTSAKLSPSNKSAPETTVHKEDKAGPDGAEKKKHQCSVCHKIFRERRDLQRHIRVHTGEKPYSCPICEKTFTRKDYLVAHIRTHTGEKPYSCPMCEKAFTQKGRLNSHIRTHTGEKPFACPVCEKSFAVKSNLRRHKKIHRGQQSI